MPIYSIDQLRRTAPEEFRGLSDNELINEYSKRKNVPFEDVASRLGVKPRSTLEQMGEGIERGIVVDIPEAVGKIIRRNVDPERNADWFAIRDQVDAMLPERRRGELRARQEADREAALRQSQAMEYAARERDMRYLPPDLRDKNIVQESLISGSRGLPQAVLTMGLGAVNPTLGAMSAYEMYGKASAVDTKRKLIEQGIPPDQAEAAAQQVERLQGGGEAVMNYLGGKLVSPFAKAMGLGAKTTAQTAAQMADTSILRPFAKAYLTSLVSEPTTEVLQDVGTTAIEEAYGGKPQDKLAIAKESAKGGFGMALLLGPFGVVGHTVRSKQAAEVKAALSDDPNVAPERRAEILQQVAAVAKSNGIAAADIDTWVQGQVDMADRQNTALAQMEDSFRQGRQADFEAAFNAPSGQRGTMPGANGQQEERELTMGELLQKNMEKITGESQVDLLDKEVKTASEFMAKLRADANDPSKPSVWQFPVSTGLQGTQRGLFAAGPTNLLEPSGQEAAPALEPNQMLAARGPVDPNAPRPAMGTLSETQAMAAAGPQGLTSAQLPVTQAPTDGSAVVPPAAPAAPGVFSSNPFAVAPSGEAGKLADLRQQEDWAKYRIAQAQQRMDAAARTGNQAVVAGARNEIAGLSEMLAGVQSQIAQLGAAVAQAAPAAAPATTTKPVPSKAARGKKAAAPATTAVAPAPAKKTVTKKTTKNLDTDLADDIEAVDDAADKALASRVKKEVEEEDLGAEVQGDKSIKFAGRMSTWLSSNMLSGIRNALLKKDGKVSKSVGPRGQKIVDAARAFANAYNDYMNAATQIVRSNKELAREDSTSDDAAKLQTKIDALTEQLPGLANNVSNALHALGQSVDNNAKNVEAIVRFVKDSVQKKLVKPGKSSDKTISAFRSLDAMLSSAWNAAKRGTFMGEEVDLADISGAEVRQSTEKQAAGTTVSAIEDAYNKGFKSPKGGKVPYKGLLGVLQYLSFHTTPHGKVLSIALQEALDESGNAPTVVFSDTERSRYDPKTNTIYLNRKEQSAEVILHETFHAALQWFVYQNPKHPAVTSLQASLKRALATEGLTGKALDVQNILRDLVGQKRGLDAVLELVSYNATLNEFRKAMQQVPSSGKTAAFRMSLSNIWSNMKRLVSQAFGLKPSLASDIMDASMQLLEESSKGDMPKKLKGNVLDVKVQSGTTVPASPQAAASGQNIMMSKDQLSKYTKTLLPRFTLTETLFNQLGWQNWMQAADKKWVTPFSKFIQKETPKLAQAVSWFNSHYGLESNVVEMLVGMKDARRGGTAVSEKIAGYIAKLPVAKSKELLSYMNDRLDYLRGIGKEPAFAGDTYMKRLADQAIDNWWKYATEGGMSAKDRAVFAGIKVGNRWVGGLKFTEGFVFPESVDQIASGSFGSRNMRELKSRRAKDEVGTDNIRFRTTIDGDPILSDKFVGIYNDTPKLRARLQAGESLANIMPDEFISADLFTQGTPLDDKGQAMLHDPAFTWDLQKKGKTGFRFSAHYDAREAYSVKKALDVANAFQNTMTLLANSYASNTFAKGLYNYGTTKVGKDIVRDGSAVVFDDLEQLNAAVNGTGEGANFKPETDSSKWTYEIKPDKVIRISANESRSDRVKGMFRNRNQWVMIPKGKGNEVYGDLSGKIVSGSVWAAIQDASNSQPVVSVPYANDIMRFFKSVKTKYLPATWATNVATNVMFAIADDIPLSTVPHAARLYVAATMSAEMRKKAGLTLTPAEEELMVKILNSNALLGTFASDEIKKGIYEAMLANLDGPERSISSRLMQMAGVDKARIQAAEKAVAGAKDKAAALDGFMDEWYAAQDNIFRVASVLNYLGKASDAGKTIDEAMVYRAGKHARAAFLDYDIDAKAIRIMRQTAFPFISFPYAATKLVGNLAVNSPWKLVNIYAAAMLADAMLSAMADDDDEETRRTGPERFRERLLGGFGPHAYFRIPFMGDSENPVYYHAGKYLFASSLVDTSPNGFMGISGFPAAITPGGPFVNGVLATVGGIDPFNGKPISDAVATDYEKVADRLVYLQSMMTPNLPFVNAAETKKFLDIAKGRTDLPAGSTSLALARYLGLRMYSYNVDAEMEKQDNAAKAIESDYKRAISRLKRKTERMEDPDWDEFYAEEEKLLQRMEKRIAELRGEEEE